MTHDPLRPQIGDRVAIPHDIELGDRTGTITGMGYGKVVVCLDQTRVALEWGTTVPEKKPV